MNYIWAQNYRNFTLFSLGGRSIISVFCILVIYPLLQAVLLVRAGVVMASLLSNCVFPVYLRSFSAINLQ